MLTIEQVLNLLVQTPSRVDALTDSTTPAPSRTRPDPDEWSANEVLAHLRACADVWGGCISAMLAEDHPTLRAVNPTTWIKATDYPEMKFHSSLGAFAQRAELLAVLEPLPDEEWSRSATVPGAGRALERTVLFYAQWLVNHERPHVKQIERVGSSTGGRLMRKGTQRRRGPKDDLHGCEDTSTHPSSVAT